MSRPMLPAPGMPGSDLPVAAHLRGFLETLLSAGSAVLVAPPGTGKTSLLPLALADLLPGVVLVAEPRRIATRAAARRLAALAGEPLGQRVGYSVRGERVVSSDVRVEVVTTGVLLRRLQSDPELPGVSAVVIDECHERQLHTDTALAFLLDIRATVREDLLLVAASATADTDRLATLLSCDPASSRGSVVPSSDQENSVSVSRSAPVIEVPAQLFPLQIDWAPARRPAPFAADSRVDHRFLDFVAATVRRALAETPTGSPDAGDVLVFLPGVAEIRAVASRLSGTVDALVQMLHGRQRPAEQDAVLREATQRRVVLSTAVAESSLTVPGVRCVVDAGLSREPRTDHDRGLSTLVTVRAAQSSATQRAGRAARLGPGRVYRCWSQTDHSHLAAQPMPEIGIADLTDFALTVACWGQPGGRGLAWLDEPPAAALAAAEVLLSSLGAVDPNGRITPRGRELARMAVHPRLARALLDGARLGGQRMAAEVVAILSDDSVVDRSEDDLVACWRALRAGRDPGRSARWRAEVARLLRAGSRPPGSPTGSGGRGGVVDGVPGIGRSSDDIVAAAIVGLAFPERLSRARQADTTQYLSAGGTGMQVREGSVLRRASWLAVAVADRRAGRADAQVRLAVVADEALAREVATPLLAVVDEISWADGGLRLQQSERLGAIELRRRPLANPDPAAVQGALQAALSAGAGLDILTWTAADRQLRWRLAACHEALGTPWPSMSTAGLIEQLPAWLGPDLSRVRSRADLRRISVGRALRRLIPWDRTPDAARLDELVPERLAVPSGSHVRLDYSPDGPPVLAVKLQELFGWAEAPRLLDGRLTVVVHLLSPAGRPVAVTADLASFWATGYPQVRAELRGRYPRHPWPEDPATALATARATPRRR